MFEQLIQLIKEEQQQQHNNNNNYSGINPTIVSNRLHISLLVAKEQLLLAEQNGFLCRDDTINGIFFYENVFPSFTIRDSSTLVK